MMKFLVVSLWLCQVGPVLSAGQPAGAPIVAVSLVSQGASPRMAPHACFAYVNTAGSILGSGDWHDCTITWTVTRADGSPVPQTTDLADPRPQANPSVADTRSGQRGFVCWYTFEAAGVYTFSATVTNNEGLTTTASINTTVVADTRRYTYLDPVVGLDTNSGASAGAPYKTWPKATASAGSNWGLLLKAGSNTLSGADWRPSGINNVRVDVYGGAAPATVTWTGPLTGLHSMFYMEQNCQNVLVRNLYFTATSVLGGGVDGVSIGNNSQGISIVGCTGTGLQTAFGGTAWSAPSDGFASVNCTVVDPGINSVYSDGWSDVVVLGLRVRNNRYSHVLRFGTDTVAGVRASVGYSDCDDNYAPAHPLDRHPFKSYMPMIYSYNSLFRNGVVGLERGLAGTDSDVRVFDACYFKNGKSSCASVNGGVNRVRFSGCIFEIENNFRSGAAPTSPDNGYSALWLNLQAGMDRLVVEGCTVLVGDGWNAGPNQPLFLFDGPGTVSNSTVKNLLVVYGKTVAGQPKVFNGPLATVPTSGVAFSGNCWPAASGSPFVVGGAFYTGSQWVGGTAVPFVHGDVLESDDRTALVNQGFRPDRTLQPLASTSSVPARASFTDYFERAFNTAGGLCGSTAGCAADFNGDGFVDGIDYDQFNNAFESPDPAQQIAADYNGDGFVDGIDYDQFHNDFAIGC